jgi:hypothetical protein
MPARMETAKNKWVSFDKKTLKFIRKNGELIRKEKGRKHFGWIKIVNKFKNHQPILKTVATDLNDSGQHPGFETRLIKMLLKFLSKTDSFQNSG